jgi:hypothetical protein
MIHLGNKGVCSGGTIQIKPPRKISQDVTKATSTEKYEKKPMKRKRRHTTDMEDLLAEDEDRLASDTMSSLNAGQESSITNIGNNSQEDHSQLLSREFSKLGIKDKHRKSKRHCTRYAFISGI